MERSIYLSNGSGEESIQDFSFVYETSLYVVNWIKSYLSSEFNEAGRLEWSSSILQIDYSSVSKYVLYLLFRKIKLKFL